ncbi:hypothetical protein BDR26DRAFT_870411 [Obelidium mucronatum]|nr:hypothetical protein BDR26DRAFT_870411 [Obelidium mucronatum]
MQSPHFHDAMLLAQEQCVYQTQGLSDAIQFLASTFQQQQQLQLQQQQLLFSEYIHCDDESATISGGDGAWNNSLLFQKDSLGYHDLSHVSPEATILELSEFDLLPDSKESSSCNSFVSDQPLTPHDITSPPSSPITETIISPSPPVPCQPASEQSMKLHRTKKSNSSCKKRIPSPPSSASSSNDDRLRKYECATCHKRFLRNQDLYRHEATHSKVKTFACQFGCGSAFTRSDALTRHMKGKRCMGNM